MFSGGKQFKVGYFGRQRPAASCPGKTSYKYDWLGRRVRKIVYGSPDVVTRYCYDGDQVIAHYNETGVLQRRFVYGVGIDEPVVMFVPGSGWYYYHYDGLGSVVALSDSSGEIVEQCSYDIFGEPSCISGVGNPYKFTGREYDAETGLYYYRARYYHTTLGRFLSPDPIRYDHGMNIYAYCWNNPINRIDPFGKDWSREGIANTFYTGPYDTARAGLYTMQAKKWARENGATSLQQNAIRHGMWSALLYSNLPHGDAEQILLVHEHYGDLGSTDSNIDFWNNEVGRQIGLENPGASKNELDEKVKEALDDGRLTSTREQAEKRGLISDKKPEDLGDDTSGSEDSSGSQSGASDSY